jgi:hypothetical protein
VALVVVFWPPCGPAAGGGQGLGLARARAREGHTAAHITQGPSCGRGCVLVIRRGEGPSWPCFCCCYPPPPPPQAPASGFSRRGARGRPRGSWRSRSCFGRPRGRVIFGWCVCCGPPSFFLKGCLLNGAYHSPQNLWIAHKRVQSETYNCTHEVFAAGYVCTDH